MRNQKWREWGEVKEEPKNEENYIWLQFYMLHYKFVKILKKQMITKHLNLVKKNGNLIWKHEFIKLSGMNSKLK